MNIIFIVPVITTICFVVFKVISTKYMEKQKTLPLKTLVKDAIAVCIASLISNLVFSYFQTPIKEFVSVITDGKPVHDANAPAEVFTDGPKF